VPPEFVVARAREAVDVGVSVSSLRHDLAAEARTCRRSPSPPTHSRTDPSVMKQRHCGSRRIRSREFNLPSLLGKNALKDGWEGQNHPSHIEAETGFVQNGSLDAKPGVLFEYDDFVTVSSECASSCQALSPPPTTPTGISSLDHSKSLPPRKWAEIQFCSTPFNSRELHWNCNSKPEGPVSPPPLVLQATVSPSRDHSTTACW
jgi:hypothetical protein